MNKKALEALKKYAPKFIVMVYDNGLYEDIIYTDDDEGGTWFFTAQNSSQLVKQMNRHKLPNRSMIAFNMDLTPVKFIPNMSKKKRETA